MKEGDKVRINFIGEKSIICECLGIWGGKCYFGDSYSIILSGIVWELTNKETITLL